MANQSIKSFAELHRVLDPQGLTKRIGDAVQKNLPRDGWGHEVRDLKIDELGRISITSGYASKDALVRIVSQSLKNEGYEVEDPDPPKRGEGLENGAVYIRAIRNDLSLRVSVRQRDTKYEISGLP